MQVVLLPGVRISVVVRWTTRVDTLVSASLVETLLIVRTLHVLLYALVDIYAHIAL